MGWRGDCQIAEPVQIGNIADVCGFWVATGVCFGSNRETEPTVTPRGPSGPMTSFTICSSAPRRLADHVYVACESNDSNDLVVNEKRSRGTHSA